MDNGTIKTIVGGIIVALFGIIHRQQSRRLGKVEDEKVNKETCDAVHEGIGREIGELKEQTKDIPEIKTMVQYLHDDRKAWKKSQGVCDDSEE